MQDTEFLDRFEKLLEDGLVKLCSGAGLLSGELLGSSDIDGNWDLYVKDYVADAVENFNEYPQSSIAWAGFLGMAVAARWDRDWTLFKDDPYRSYYGKRGFDDMDEHILEDIVKLSESDEAKYSNAMNSCALAALSLIRHEGIEPQTAQGFYILVRTYTVLYKIGAALELHRLGYKKVAVG